MPESPFIEELKKAGEEIKKAGRTVPPKVGKPSNPLEVEEKEKTDLEELRGEKEIISLDWQKEIINERQKLEKAYQEVEGLRRKIQQRLDRIRRLEADFTRVKNEISHFQQTQKGNQAFLEEIKNILKNE